MSMSLAVLLSVSIATLGATLAWVLSRPPVCTCEYPDVRRWKRRDGTWIDACGRCFRRMK